MYHEILIRSRKHGSNKPWMLLENLSALAGHGVTLWRLPKPNNCGKKEKRIVHHQTVCWLCCLLKSVRLELPISLLYKPLKNLILSAFHSPSNYSLIKEKKKTILPKCLAFYYNILDQITILLFYVSDTN